MKPRVYSKPHYIPYCISFLAVLYDTVYYASFVCNVNREKLSIFLSGCEENVAYLFVSGRTWRTLRYPENTNAQCEAVLKDFFIKFQLTLKLCIRVLEVTQNDEWIWWVD